MQNTISSKVILIALALGVGVPCLYAVVGMFQMIAGLSH